ncbi:MAG: GNAT family N-acetyltransferase [Angelakisella sp.]|jgi:L-amino acid N-acyltransferase YncA|nr:GNAT family N-acetyltransferase [Angelakisella sp.]
MNLVTIREAVPDDAADLLAVYAYFVRETAITFEYDVPATAEFRERIRRTLERYPYLVAEKAGKILGYAYAGPFSGRAAYQWSCEVSIYLDRAAQGGGLGRRLYEALEVRLREMGIRNLYACIAWPPARDPYLTRNSAEFHAHLGFVTVGEFHRCGNKFGRWYDMIWMEKFIGDHGPNPQRVRFPKD